MDPAVLDDLDTKVPAYHSQVRSLLVVRHGYLVYERYWQGFAASDGHEVRSVTKSVTAALVGIALGEASSRALTRPSASCSPATCPTTPTRAWPGSPSSSC